MKKEAKEGKRKKNRLIEAERELDISVHCIYLLTFELFTSESIVRSRNQMEGIIIINEDDISRMDDQMDLQKITRMNKWKIDKRKKC